MDSSATAGRRTKEDVLRAALVGAVILATFWPRLAGLRLVFAGGGIVQWDGDSAYHLKRILHALAHFPDVLRFDPAMNWPAGAPCPWPDGFDLLAAAWGLVLGLGDPARATIAVLLFTPMLALLAVWAAMDLSRLVIPDGPGKEGAVAAVGILTSLEPSALFLSQVGFLDHHIAELLAAMLLAGWALRRLPGPGATFARSPLAWEIGGALAATFALWVFAGAALYVALAFAIVLAASLLDERPRLLGSGVPALSAAAALSALLSVPAIRAHGRLVSYQFPSLLPSLLVLAAALALAIAVVAARVASRRWARIALLAGAGAGLALVAALALPKVAGEIRDGLVGWLLRKDPWIGTISEFQPLGADPRGYLQALFSHFGALGFCAPLVLAAGGWTMIRAERGRGIAFVALSAGFVLFTLNQVRFGRIGVPLLTIHAAAAFAAIAHRRRPQQHLWAVRIFPALAALVLVVCDPFMRPSLSPSYIGLPSVVRAALELGVEAKGGSRPGVLTPWDFGHTVNVLSGLPTITNGFGPYLDPEVFGESEEIYRKDPPSLDEFLDRHRARFIIAGAMTGPMLLGKVNGRKSFVRSAEGVGAILDLEFMKSFGLSPLLIGGSAIPGSGVRHLEHLMPIFASPEKPPGLAFALPSFWTYERVEGARLAGTAPPRSRVLATLDLREQGRPHVWRAYADAGDDGRFELVTPLPTGHARPTLSTAASYSLRIGGGPAVQVEVPEHAVRAGDTIRVGAIREARQAAEREPDSGKRTSAKSG